MIPSVSSSIRLPSRTDEGGRDGHADDGDLQGHAGTPLIADGAQEHAPKGARHEAATVDTKALADGQWEGGE
jgi:hypothetical protein